jgi:hypothetical protein
LQVIQFGGDTGQIADAIVVTVAKGPGIYLINNAIPPPKEFFTHMNPPNPSNYTGLTIAFVKMWKIPTFRLFSGINIS